MTREVEEGSFSQAKIPVQGVSAVVGQWQPIETAPRDGTEIVGHDQATGTSHVTAADQWGRWIDPDQHYYSEAPPFIPTLWMPFPDATPDTPAAGTFQDRVQGWVNQCFGEVIASNAEERADRFVEEALELVQSVGYDAARAHALVDYVWGRPAGDPPQEVGGVMVTLATLCHRHGIDMVAAGEVELARILQPEIVEKIRRKQAAKPTGSALPIATPAAGNGGRQAGINNDFKALQGGEEQ